MVKKENAESSPPLLIKGLFIFSIIFFIHWHIYGLPESYTNLCKSALYWILILHSVRQHFGVSLMYNYKHLARDKVRGSYREKLFNLAAMERKIFFLLVVLSSLQGMLNVHLVNYFSEYSFYFNFTLSALGMFLVLYLLWRIFYLNGPLFKHKFLFLLRLVLYPLSFFSILSIIGLQAAHGLEYFLVSKKVTTGTEIDRRPLIVFICIVLGFFVLALALLSARHGILGMLTAGESPKSRWYDLVWVTATAMAYVHYWLDAKIYKMSDPNIKKFLFPILSK